MIFRKTYFVLAVLIFIIEVLIALFVHDNFIRPYFGDTLVVILIYCFIQAFFNGRVLPVATGVLLFAYTIEFLQYIHIVNKLGLETSRLASTVIGTWFSWNDLVAYSAGFVLILVVEKFAVAKST